jgi:hypothetical protein
MIAKFMEILKKLWNGEAKIHYGEIAVPELEWHTAELQNGWTGKIEYAKPVSNFVVVEGRALGKSSSSHREILAILPAGYHQIGNTGIAVPVYCSNLSPYGGMMGIIIVSNGEIRIVDPLASAVNSDKASLNFQAIFKI